MKLKLDYSKVQIVTEVLTCMKFHLYINIMKMHVNYEEVSFIFMGFLGINELGFREIWFLDNIAI